MSKELTSEEKLKAIIKAHGLAKVEGFELMKLDKEMVFLQSKTQVIEGPVLRLRLDTQGCKNAYGEDLVEEFDGWANGAKCGRYNDVTRKILLAWHSEEGNQWKAAIDTAYSLLPSND